MTDAQFKILSFHRQSGSIQIKYFNDLLPDGIIYALTLPLIEGKLPQGDALEQFILSFVPHDAFKRAAELKNANPNDGLAALPEPASQDPMDWMMMPNMVREGDERIFLVKPLVQVKSLDIPLHVL